jgi:hypothetical protein
MEAEGAACSLDIERHKACRGVKAVIAVQTCKVHEKKMCSLVLESCKIAASKSWKSAALQHAMMNVLNYESLSCRCALQVCSEVVGGVGAQAQLRFHPPALAALDCSIAALQLKTGCK